VERHLGVLRDRLPAAIPLYLAAAKAQLPLARALGDAPQDTFDAIEKFLASVAEK
jgi:hypothetical protein